jgi:hypothetical protein
MTWGLVVEKCRATEDDTWASPITTIEGIIMGKYALAWLLGVPGIVLVLIYFFMR